MAGYGVEHVRDAAATLAHELFHIIDSEEDLLYDTTWERNPAADPRPTAGQTPQGARCRGRKPQLAREAGFRRSGIPPLIPAYGGAHP